MYNLYFAQGMESMMFIFDHQMKETNSLKRVAFKQKVCLNT